MKDNLLLIIGIILMLPAILVIINGITTDLLKLLLKGATPFNQDKYVFAFILLFCIGCFFLAFTF